MPQVLARFSDSEISFFITYPFHSSSIQKKAISLLHLPLPKLRYKNSKRSKVTLDTLDFDVPVVLDELLAVVLDDEVVVVHHDGERLADDEREPHADVAGALTDVNLDPARDEDQGDLGNS